jgi:hypothetical protein
MSTLTIKMDGDQLIRTMSWPDQKETNLQDLKLKEGDLTFSAVQVVGDNKYIPGPCPSCPAQWLNGRFCGMR